MTDTDVQTQTSVVVDVPPPRPPAPPTTDQPDPAPDQGGTDRRVILLLSGANLALLGQRDPGVYGTTTLDDLVQAARETAESVGFELSHVHSDAEHELVAAIHRARSQAAAIVINPGAFTHYAWAIHDALDTFDGPVLELHLSNPQAREAWRHTSVVSPVATATIAGLGALGYPLAIRAAAALVHGQE